MSRGVALAAAVEAKACGLLPLERVGSGSPFCTRQTDSVAGSGATRGVFGASTGQVGQSSAGGTREIGEWRSFSVRYAARRCPSRTPDCTIRGREPSVWVEAADSSGVDPRSVANHGLGKMERVVKNSGTFDEFEQVYERWRRCEGDAGRGGRSAGEERADLSALCPPL